MIPRLEVRHQEIHLPTSKIKQKLSQLNPSTLYQQTKKFIAMTNQAHANAL